MSERQGLLPWPSDDICEIIAAARPSSGYVDEQFLYIATRNFAISYGLEELSGTFRRTYDAFCGEMFMFSGVQTYKMLDLAVQKSGQRMPVSTRAIADVIKRSLEEPGNYVNETYDRLKEDNPPIHGHIHELCKSRNIVKRGPPAINAVKSGGIFVYSMLELKAEADKLAEEFKK